jgi:NAD(P)-dependent dehydrogenase (short-subunit alcohol dehydrogenase family)
MFKPIFKTRKAHPMSQHTLIAGGSSGIGLATARRLLAQGHKVTIAARNREKLEAARAGLAGDVHALVMDATDAPSLPGLFAGVGGIDHLVLALGSGKGFGPFAEMKLADMRQSFEEKVFAHFAVAQAALPHLRKDGSLTLVAAVSAQAAMPGTSGIGAANAAVEALARILAAELRPLRVNAVSPGVIDTPWWDFLDTAQKDALFADYAAKTPVGRIGRAEDIADTIAFVIGNSFLTAQAIVCDGGLRLPA